MDGDDNYQKVDTEATSAVSTKPMNRLEKEE
jgi:hypothetical protein